MSTSPHHVGRDIVTVPRRINHAGWLVSYADLMTILLTFMVLLLSMAVIPQTKFDMFVQGITGEKVGNLQEVKTKIDEVIRGESLGGEVTTHIDDRGLTLEFSNALLFESGEAELTERAHAALVPIAKHLVHDLEPVYGVIIEGYTDDVPIANARFRSNWELSTSRAIGVMERLTEAGLDRRRMSVQGFADTRPVDAVATDAARAANRRVVLRIDRLHPDVLEHTLRDLLPAPSTSTSEAP